MAPVFAAKYNWLSRLHRPLHEHLLGSHKTWRGIVAGLVFGSVTSLIQFLVFPYPPFISLPRAVFLGGVLGLGALLGDAVKSFFKRRLNIAPGKSLPIVDQVDATIGALLFVSPFVALTLAHVITAVIIFGPISFLVSYLGVKLKIKSSL